jgi:hypothetical protein
MCKHCKDPSNTKKTEKLRKWLGNVSEMESFNNRQVNFEHNIPYRIGNNKTDHHIMKSVTK